MKYFIKFIQLFGLVNGVTLAFKFKLNAFTDIRLPQIKHPILLRKIQSDKATFFQVFVKKQYNIQYPEQPAFIIDGGANIGFFTVFIKNKFPLAKVVCVEPDKDNFETLCKNTENYNNVCLEHSALWNKSTMLSVNDSVQKSAITVNEINKAEVGNETQVKSMTIHDILNKYNTDRIDILKLDIETSEKELFAADYSWLKKTKVIIIELHDWINAGSSNSFFKAISESLENFSFSQNGENVIIVNNCI